MYSSAVREFYCSDGNGGSGDLCKCYYSMGIVYTYSFQRICDSTSCKVQYCAGTSGNGFCSYCSPGEYSAFGLSCISCLTCSLYASTTGSCSNYGSTSDVSCTCNSRYSGNGITCTRSCNAGTYSIYTGGGGVGMNGGMEWWGLVRLSRSLLRGLCVLSFWLRAVWMCFCWALGQSLRRWYTYSTWGLSQTWNAVLNINTIIFTLWW
jgi:hypothetical protein